MSTSSAQSVGYRVLQAVCDLRSVAQSAKPHVAGRIVAGCDGMVSPADFEELIRTHGCRIVSERHLAMHSGLVLAATLPDDDAETFRVATAILLADRLQRGLGEDDLFWHWDAFQGAYLLLTPQDRAAILQGFAQATSLGLVAITDPPGGAAIATQGTSETLNALERVIRDGAPLSGAAGTLACVLSGEAPSGAAAEIWAMRQREIQTIRMAEAAPVLAGFRHVYETRADFNPFPMMNFDLELPGQPVIPVLR